jgi:hypothetical protein
MKPTSYFQPIVCLLIAAILEQEEELGPDDLLLLVRCG